MKKLLSMIMAVAVLASSILLINANADTAPRGTLVGKSVTANPGDTIEIPVTANTGKTAGVVALGFQVEYDRNVLELVGWTNGQMFPAAAVTTSELVTNYPYLVQYEDGLVEAKKGEKLLGTFKFKVKDSAVVAKDGYTVKFSMLDGYTYDFDTNDIDFDVTNAVVTVVCKSHKYDDNGWTQKSAATCTAAEKLHRFCTVCGGGEQEKDGKGALGHDYKITTTAATCEQDGQEVTTCTRCDYKTTKTLSKLGHKFTKYVETKPATCTEQGEETATCDHEGCTKTDVRKTKALGHNFGEFKETKAATCTEKGVKTATCERCGETKTDEIPALGHEVKDWTVTVEPTLETEGKRTGTCERCKETVEQTVPKLTKEVKTDKDSKVEVSIDAEEPFTGYTEVKVSDIATSEADKVDGKDVVGGYKIDIVDSDTGVAVAADKKVQAKIKLTDAMKAAYKDFGIAIDGATVESTVTDDGYLTFTAEAGKLSKVVVLGTKIENNGGDNTNGGSDAKGGSENGDDASTSPKTGEATGAALAVTLFAAAAAGVVLSKKKRG